MINPEVQMRRVSQKRSAFRFPANKKQHRALELQEANVETAIPSGSSCSWSVFRVYLRQSFKIPVALQVCSQTSKRFIIDRTADCLLFAVQVVPDKLLQFTKPPRAIDRSRGNGASINRNDTIALS
jgi:hypothetical protein